MSEFDANAPVIIGVGEASRKTVAGEWPSPRELAGAAIKVALADTGQPQAVAAAIDTIAAIRTFEDSGVSMGTGASKVMSAAEVSTQPVAASASRAPNCTMHQ